LERTRACARGDCLVALKLSSDDFASKGHVRTLRAHKSIRAPSFRRLKGSRPGRLHGLHRLGNAQDAHHSLEVVREDVQAHFSAYMVKRPHEEVRRTHPVLQSSEDMLDGASSHFHGVRLAIQAALHCIKYCFMFPAPHATLVSRRALS